MKRGSRKANNGYIGVDYQIIPNTGVLTPNKLYNMDIRELPYYPFGNTANAFGVPASNYQRPTEWPALPNITAGSQQIAGLFAVYNNESNVCSIQISGAYQVNWGDGTTGAYTSNTIAIKRYDQTSYAGLTSSVFRNYKTALITITPQSGNTFTSVDFAPPATSGVTGIPGFGAIASTNWLDIRMSAPALTTIAVSRWAGNARSSRLLEQFEFIGNAALTSLTFISASSLRKIISFPSTRLVSSWQSVFYGCSALQEIPTQALDGLAYGTISGQAFYTFYQCHQLLSLPISIIDCRNVTTGLEGFFNQCFNLRRVPTFINTSNVQNMNSMFAECSSLQELPSLDTTRNTNFGSMFYNCHTATKAPDSFAGASGTNFALMFIGCRNLKQLPFINTRNGQSFADFIRDCHSIETVPAYDYTNATNFTRLFYQCYNLKYIPDLNNGLTMTNMDAAFFACSSLIEAPGITTDNVTNINNLYDACTSLKTIPSYNFQKATSFTTPFPRSSSLISFGGTGISFSFSLVSNALGSTALNSIYNSLFTVGISGAGARTLTVSGNWGFTASDRSIAIGKGWAVV